MPLVNISMRAGKPGGYRQAVFDGIYRAMRETFDVPDDDQFMTITEHDSDNFRYSASYLGVARSDDLVIVQITASNTRSFEQKKALFRRLAEVLAECPGLRPEDVFVSFIEVAKANRSLGHGLAQYA